MKSTRQILAVILWSFLLLPLVAQPDSDLDAQFLAAAKASYEGRQAEGLALYRAIATSASDEDAVINAREGAAQNLVELGRPEEAVAELDLAVAGFPETRRLLEIEKLKIYFTSPREDFTSPNPEIEALVVRFGGPSFREVMQNPEAVLPRIQALATRYDGAWNSYRRCNDVALDGVDGEKRLVTFLRNNWRGYSAEAFEGDSESLVRFASGDWEIPPDWEPDAVAPELLGHSPPEGFEGTVATVSFTLGDGPIVNVSSTDLSTLMVKLDGQDVTDQLTFSSNLHLELTAPYVETLDVSFPVTNLQSGLHRINVSVKDRSEQLAEYSWTFRTVAAPPPGPTTETRVATKDALVYERGPHLNEGANPRLTLEKITGKASRDLMGFDLSNINLNRLTKATLVLSIDSSELTTGWGNGETIRLQPVTTDWTEGNGRGYGLPNSQQTPGSGSGTTWFSPIDTNIANDSSNSTVLWNGGATYAVAGTAPAQVIRNHQTGEVRFDVTQDIINGVSHGWLLRKDAENKGSKVTFTSKEGAAQAGNSDLAPRLILEYGSSSAQTPPLLNAVTAFLGLDHGIAFQEMASNRETPGLKAHLSSHPRAAFVAERLVTAALQPLPLGGLAGRIAYRSWLRGGLSLA